MPVALEKDSRSMFLVSAPGKVILFGEHAVVHGVPAIAASVAIHNYMLVEKSVDPEIVEILFPEVDLHLTLKRNELPWSAVSLGGRSLLNPHPDLDDKVVDAIEQITKPLVEKTQNEFLQPTTLAFLYLYLHLCTSETPGYRFVSRSALPVGAGLGSSASFSVCLSSALLYIGNHIEAPQTKLDANLVKINDWAFLGEKCIHGNPSGIDNVVASRGGAVLYERQPLPPHKVTPYASFPPLGLVLTNTGVPRRTSQLVAGVGKLKMDLPEVVKPILRSIANIVAEADREIKDTSSSSSDIATSIGRLANINHGLLVALGVSHPSLERVREMSELLQLGSTKLTGAGGGGCAITIEAPGAHEKIEEFSRALGPPYEVFETILGGPGAGIVFDVADMAVLPAKGDLDVAELNALNWHHW